MAKKKQMDGGRGSTSAATTTKSYMDLKGQKMDMKSIMKDIEFLGSSHMTWRDRKELENRKVVALGGKPPKKQRLPLSVARVTMKKQKERDQKMLEENSVLGRFGAKLGNGAKRGAEKRKAEDKVLKATEGHFRNGVLDVKRLLQPAAPKERDNSTDAVNKRMKKGGGGKNRGKKGGGGGRNRGKKGGKKRH